MSASCLSGEEMHWPLTRALPVVRITSDHLMTESDTVADEVPVALVYNDISHAVMLASPADLEDFAIGFSLGEGIIDTAEEIYGCEAQPTCDGIALHIHLAGERFIALKARRRTLAGRTGCGLCGVDSLAAVTRPTKKVMPLALRSQAIHRALQALGGHQLLFSSTGAVHAAAWVDLSGQIIAVREDVGRHNALDKLIGWRARSGYEEVGFVVVSSRASFEMVQKAAQAGIGCLVAISAPTAMAVRLAGAADLTLVGFARDGKLSVYSHAEHIHVS